MAIVILIKTPDGEVSELPVLHRIVLGRSSSCDFPISDKKMSGTHCAFEVTTKGQLIFKDLGSTNGSFLNNSAVQEVHVKINDIIKIGDTLVQIYEKRLGPSDKAAIGYSKVKPSNDKTLPELAELNLSPREKTIMLKRAQESKESAEKKRSVIGLSDKMKQEKEKEKESREKMKMGSTKNVMDREHSSGNTKFLELEEEKKKKKG